MCEWEELHEQRAVVSGDSSDIPSPGVCKFTVFMASVSKFVMHGIGGGRSLAKRYHSCDQGQCDSRGGCPETGTNVGQVGRQLTISTNTCGTAR